MFNQYTLIEAISTLFQQNGYQVTPSFTIHGAQVDLKVESLRDPFAEPIYIEATVEHVDNDKYGKDVGKLALLQRKEPSARCMIISARGFTDPVRERAEQTGYLVFTYDALFAKFERFESLIQSITKQATDHGPLATLVRIYEEPLFHDRIGKEPATGYLNTWRTTATSDNRWLLITGDYGTGKTALTKILEYRWALEYRSSPKLPIPFRIELRNFTRQFDARGLLHHFLDTNNLGHIPIDFVESLIRQGRVILLLDGYDEMAQYMHFRERRVCLEALASLAAEGAKGILTSRPNYFSEAEELGVFEALYSALPNAGRTTSQLDELALERERQLDHLLRTQVIERRERNLQDLSQIQTESLVMRALEGGPEGQSVVLDILKRVFREGADGAELALSGKPVIISYLLELVEDLKAKAPGSAGRLSEWSAYALIIDRLMDRDYRRSHVIFPSKRRRFLQQASMHLSRRNNPTLTEDAFKGLIHREFATELRSVPPEEKDNEVDRLFGDLRASATLTRAIDRERGGWKFSHNSLREFLAAEALLYGMISGQPIADSVPISDAMRRFVYSHSNEEISSWLHKLAPLIGQASSYRALGQLLVLLWDAGLKLHTNANDPVQAFLLAVFGDTRVINGLPLDRLRFVSSKPCQLDGWSFLNCQLSDCDLSDVSLQGAKFTGLTAENVSFANTNLRGADFSQSLLIEVDFTGADLSGACFAHLDTPILRVQGPAGTEKYEGKHAIGYLRHSGATTDEVEPYYVYIHHKLFSVVEKVCRKLTEQTWVQKLGLVKKGASRQDPQAANELIELLIKNHLVEENEREHVSATQSGRDALVQLLEQRTLPEVFELFFKNH